MTLQFPCVCCNKAVKTNQRGLQCTTCFAWMHTICAGIKNQLYDDVNHDFLNWQCTKCLFQCLPFSDSLYANDHETEVINLKESISQNYCENNTSEMLSLKFDNFENDGFKCTHLNIRSLFRNFDEIKLFLHENDIHILALNETLLDNSISNNELHIQDYDLIRKDRNRNGGGVAVYIRSTVNYELITSDLLDPLEVILIKVQIKSSTPFLFMSWYRPPDSKIEVIDHYENILAFADSFHLNILY